MKRMPVDSIAWECPVCGHRHLWRWAKGEATPGAIWMGCEMCKSDSRLTLAQIGARVWAAVWGEDSR